MVTKKKLKYQNPKIVVTPTTKKRLDNLGTKTDTYDFIINKVIDKTEIKEDI